MVPTEDGMTASKGGIYLQMEVYVFGGRHIAFERRQHALKVAWDLLRAA